MTKATPLTVNHADVQAICNHFRIQDQTAVKHILDYFVANRSANNARNAKTIARKQ